MSVPRRLSRKKIVLTVICTNGLHEKQSCPQAEANGNEGQDGKYDCHSRDQRPLGFRHDECRWSDKAKTRRRRTLNDLADAAANRYYINRSCFADVMKVAYDRCFCFQVGPC